MFAGRNTDYGTVFELPIPHITFFGCPMLFFCRGMFDIMTGFTTESPNKKFVILADSGRFENLLQALETRAANGYRVVQCWASGGGQGFGSSNTMTYVLLEKDI